MLINWEDLEPLEILEEIVFGLANIPTHIQEAWIAILIAKNDLDMSQINRSRVELIDVQGELLEHVTQDGELVVEHE